MKTSLNHLVLALLGAVALAPNSARAIEFNVLGGFNHTKVNLNYPSPLNSPDVSSDSAFVAGAGLTFGLVPLISLEADALFDRTQFDALDNGVSSEYSLKSFTFPIQLRYTFFPLFSVGAGPYFRFARGSVDIHNQTTGTTSSTDYDRSNFAKSDFGAVVSIGASIPLPLGFSVMGDARYYLGLKNLYTGTIQETTFKYSGFQLLVGAQFEL